MLYWLIPSFPGRNEGWAPVVIVNLFSGFWQIEAEQRALLYLFLLLSSAQRRFLFEEEYSGPP